MLLPAAGGCSLSVSDVNFGPLGFGVAPLVETIDVNMPNPSVSLIRVEADSVKWLVLGLLLARVLPGKAWSYGVRR
jgi:hypothetical protein